MLHPPGNVAGGVDNGALPDLGLSRDGQGAKHLESWRKTAGLHSVVFQTAAILPGGRLESDDERLKQSGMFRTVEGACPVM